MIRDKWDNLIKLQDPDKQWLYSIKPKLTPQRSATFFKYLKDNLSEYFLGFETTPQHGNYWFQFKDQQTRDTVKSILDKILKTKN